MAKKKKAPSSDDPFYLEIGDPVGPFTEDGEYISSPVSAIAGFYKFSGNGQVPDKPDPTITKILLDDISKYAIFYWDATYVHGKKGAYGKFVRLKTMSVYVFDIEEPFLDIRKGFLDRTDYEDDEDPPTAQWMDADTDPEKVHTGTVLYVPSKDDYFAYFLSNNYNAPRGTNDYNQPMCWYQKTRTSLINHGLSEVRGVFLKKWQDTWYFNKDRKLPPVRKAEGPYVTPDMQFMARLSDPVPYLFKVEHAWYQFRKLGDGFDEVALPSYSDEPNYEFDYILNLTDVSVRDIIIDAQKQNIKCESEAKMQDKITQNMYDHGMDPDDMNDEDEDGDYLDSGYDESEGEILHSIKQKNTTLIGMDQLSLIASLRRWDQYETIDSDQIPVYLKDYLFLEPDEPKRAPKKYNQYKRIVLALESIRPVAFRIARLILIPGAEADAYGPPFLRADERVLFKSGKDGEGPMMPGIFKSLRYNNHLSTLDVFVDDDDDEGGTCITGMGTGAKAREHCKIHTEFPWRWVKKSKFVKTGKHSHLGTEATIIDDRGKKHIIGGKWIYPYTDLGPAPTLRTRLDEKVPPPSVGPAPTLKEKDKISIPSPEIRIYVPPEPTIIKPPKVKIIRPPEPEIYRPSPPEPAPPEPLPPEELPERERKLIKKKKKVAVTA